MAHSKYTTGMMFFSQLEAYTHQCVKKNLYAHYILVGYIYDGIGGVDTYLKEYLQGNVRRFNDV